MDLSELLKKQIKKGGFSIETLAKGFCDEIGKKVGETTFLAVFQNLENKTSMTLCDACGCGPNGSGFDVIEELEPMDILDAQTRSMVKMSSFAGFGPKKMNKVILDGLGAVLAEQKEKFGHDIVLIMGEFQCKDCSFVIMEINRNDLEVGKPLAQISIVEAMQKSEDVKELFA